MLNLLVLSWQESGQTPIRPIDTVSKEPSQICPSLLKLSIALRAQKYVQYICLVRYWYWRIILAEPTEIWAMWQRVVRQELQTRQELQIALPCLRCCSIHVRYFLCTVEYWPRWYLVNFNAIWKGGKWSQGSLQIGSHYIAAKLPVMFAFSHAPFK